MDNLALKLLLACYIGAAFAAFLAWCAVLVGKDRDQ